MTWNYRVVRSPDPVASGADATYTYGIHEVFYDADGKPDGISEYAQDVIGDTVDDVKWLLNKMVDALGKPVLDYDTREEITGAPK